LARKSSFRRNTPRESIGEIRDKDQVDPTNTSYEGSQAGHSEKQKVYPLNFAKPLHHRDDPQANLKILVANDEEVSLLVLEVMITGKLNVKLSNFYKASNGLQAFQQAVNTDFDIVILDLNMPIMDGF